MILRMLLEKHGIEWPENKEHEKFCHHHNVCTCGNSQYNQAISDCLIALKANDVAVVPSQEGLIPILYDWKYTDKYGDITKAHEAILNLLNATEERNGAE